MLTFIHHSSFSYMTLAFPTPIHRIAATGILVSIINSRGDNKSQANSKKSRVIIIIHIINKIASLKDDNPMIIISNYYEINY